MLSFDNHGCIPRHRLRLRMLSCISDLGCPTAGRERPQRMRSPLPQTKELTGKMVANGCLLHRSYVSGVAESPRRTTSLIKLLPCVGLSDSGSYCRR
jgi:hypothetical protein